MLFAVIVESSAAPRVTLAISMLENSNAYSKTVLLPLVQPSLYPVSALMGVHVTIMGTSNLLLNYREKPKM